MTDKQNRVAILLSTFNGERFLQEQLDSLRAQTHADCDIFVRDDGSTDATLALLRRDASAHGRMQVQAGANLGFVGSFFELLQMAGDGYDFYFFCDQDDVWLADKVASAVAALAPRQEAALYCSRTECVDAQLQPIGPSPDYPPAKIGWGNALVQNIATGCTMALNAPARRLLLSGLPRHCLAHDWWAYLVVSAFGAVVFDANSYIRYRQHGNNAIGMQQGGLRGQWARVQRFVRHLRRSGPGWLDQLAEFDRVHGHRLDAGRRGQVHLLLQSRRRWLAALRVARMRFYWRMNPTDTRILRVLLALRLY
ncbi:hypothetical protein GCM10027082_02430 [Comamonas humi]